MVGKFFQFFVFFQQIVFWIFRTVYRCRSQLFFVLIEALNSCYFGVFFGTNRFSSALHRNICSDLSGMCRLTVGLFVLVVRAA